MRATNSIYKTLNLPMRANNSIYKKAESTNESK